MIGGTAGTAQAAGSLVESAVGRAGCWGSEGDSEGAAGGSCGAAH